MTTLDGCYSKCLTPNCSGDAGFARYCRRCQEDTVAAEEWRTARARAAVERNQRDVARKLREAKRRRAIHGLIYVAALLGFLAWAWTWVPR